MCCDVARGWKFTGLCYSIQFKLLESCKINDSTCSYDIIVCSVKFVAYWQCRNFYNSPCVGNKRIISSAIPYVGSCRLGWSTVWTWTCHSPISTTSDLGRLYTVAHALSTFYMRLRRRFPEHAGRPTPARLLLSIVDFVTAVIVPVTWRR